VDRNSCCEVTAFLDALVGTTWLGHAKEAVGKIVLLVLHWKSLGHQEIRSTQSMSLVSNYYNIKKEFLKKEKN